MQPGGIRTPSFSAIAETAFPGASHTAPRALENSVHGSRHGRDTSSLYNAVNRLNVHMWRSPRWKGVELDYTTPLN